MTQDPLPRNTPHVPRPAMNRLPHPTDPSAPADVNVNAQATDIMAEYLTGVKACSGSLVRDALVPLAMVIGKTHAIAFWERLCAAQWVTAYAPADGSVVSTADVHTGNLYYQVTPLFSTDVNRLDAGIVEARVINS